MHNIRLIKSIRKHYVCVQHYALIHYKCPCNALQLQAQSSFWGKLRVSCQNPASSKSINSISLLYALINSFVLTAKIIGLSRVKGVANSSSAVHFFHLIILVLRTAPINLLLTHQTDISLKRPKQSAKEAEYWTYI